MTTRPKNLPDSRVSHESALVNGHNISAWSPVGNCAHLGVVHSLSHAWTQNICTVFQKTGDTEQPSSWYDH